jgi:hypothetical protein
MGDARMHHIDRSTVEDGPSCLQVAQACLMAWHNKVHVTVHAASANGSVPFLRHYEKRLHTTEAPRVPSTPEMLPAPRGSVPWTVKQQRIAKLISIKLAGC